MSRWLLMVAFCLSSFAYAEIEILSVTGASNFQVDTNNRYGNPVIYGGVGGDLFNCRDDEDGVSLCNNCEELSSFEICNEKRVYDSLAITVTFRSNSSSGRAFVRNEGDSLNNNTTSELEAGATHTVEVLWNDVCWAIEEGAHTCEGMTGSRSLTLSIEGNGEVRDSVEVTFVVATPDASSNTNKATMDSCEASEGTDAMGGICDFRAVATDHGNFIQNFVSNGAFPNEDSIQISKVRVFISDQGFNDISSPNDGLIHEDLPVVINDDGSHSIVSYPMSLAPGVGYFFRLGVIDMAGNMSRVTSDSAIAEACGSVVTPTEDCPYSMIAR